MREPRIGSCTCPRHDRHPAEQADLESGQRDEIRFGGRNKAIFQSDTPFISRTDGVLAAFTADQPERRRRDPHRKRHDRVADLAGRVVIIARSAITSTAA